jgi:hypothetical protein
VQKSLREGVLGFVKEVFIVELLHLMNNQAGFSVSPPKSRKCLGLVNAANK